MYPQDLNSKAPNEHSKRQTIIECVDFLMYKHLWVLFLYYFPKYMIYREHLPFILSLKQSNCISYLIRWYDYYPIEYLPWSFSYFSVENVWNQMISFKQVIRVPNTFYPVCKEL